MSIDVFGIEGRDNTTTTPLGSAETFTGQWENSALPDVMVSCETDVPGTLYFDFSNNDGSNVNTFPSAGFAVAAGIHEFHVAVKGPRQFRVRLVNGAGAQTYLRLYTYYGSFQKPNAPLNQPLGLDADATLVRPTFPWLDLARGLVSGMSDVKKFGRNNAVGTTYAAVAFGGVYRTPQSGAATALRVAAGGNANDAAGGSGAREITLEGLDENWELVSEAVATNGASASSATTATFTRLFRAYVSASGTYATATAGSHAANIVIENSAGGTTWATIDSANFPKGQSEIGAYSVPTGKSAYIFLDDITIDSTKTTDVVFFHRGGADETAAPYTAMRAKSVLVGLDSNASLAGRTVPFGPFTGPCDVGFLAKVSVGTASVAVEFEIYLVDE